MHKVKNELCEQIMLDLFKEVTHPCNLRNKIKTVRYGIEIITDLGPQVWSIVPD